MAETVTREWVTEGCIVRNESDPMRPSGYVVPYESMSAGREPWGMDSELMREFFARGSMTVPKGKKILLRADHLRNSQSIVGEMADYEQRDDGLWGQFELYDTQAGKDAATLIDRQAVTGLSMEAPIKGSKTTQVTVRGGQKARRIDRATLSGVGLVEYPAYRKARAAFRAAHLDPVDEYLTGPSGSVIKWQKRLAELRRAGKDR